MKSISSLFMRWRQPKTIPVIYLVALSIGILPALMFSLRSPSEAGNAIFLGYSLERLVLGAFLFTLFITFVVAAFLLARKPDVSRKIWEKIFTNQKTTNKVFWLSGLFVLLTYILLFLPAYRLGRLAGYIDQLRPVIVWLTASSVLTNLLVVFEIGKISKGLDVNKAFLRIWSVVLVLFVLMTLIPFLSGFGLKRPEDYWYPTGVPIMGLQVIFSLIIGVWTMMFERNKEKGLTSRFDLVICIALWVMVALLWAREPIRTNYFMPDTANNPMFPYSDSAIYDTSSQFALIGQGLFNGNYFDRALYMAFLTYLHMLFGQDYDALLFTQAIIFAVFPVLIYLLGRELHSRALGLSAAVLISLRGLNSLVGATWLDTASPKMILTDFAAAIGVAAIVLFSLKWLKSPLKGTNAVLAGASLGLTIMLRTNVVLLIPAILFCFWFIWRRMGKSLFLGGLLFVIGMISFTTPWDIRNRSNGIPMFYVYYSRIETVLRVRYGINGGALIPPPPLASDTESLVKTPDRSIRQRNNGVDDLPYCQYGICKVVNHFAHNYLASILYLPSSLVLDDLWNTVKLSTPYWLNSWRGQGIGIYQAALIFFNLAMVSLGITAAWRKNKLVAFIPLILFGVYIASNSLALTSGGRYIVPVDWILSVYFILGLLTAFDWLLQYGGFIPSDSLIEFDVDANNFIPQNKSRTKNIVGSFLVVIVLGTLVPFSEIPFDRQYPEESVSDTLDRLDQLGVLADAPFSREEFEQFLIQPDAAMRVGRILYPRYYPENVGEADKHYPYVKLQYPRLVFQVIGPFNGRENSGKENVIIAGDMPPYNLHAVDVVVVGCLASQRIDGIMLFILSEERNDIYLRAPLPELKCPLASPGSVH